MNETADFFNDTGAQLASEGFHAEAIAYLKKGLVLEPHNSLLWFNLGLSYYALKQQNESKNAFFQAVQCNPADADAWDSLGVILCDMGEQEAAEKAYKQAVMLEPYTGRIWNNYGTLLFNMSQYDEARNAFESAITLDPDLGDAVFNLCDTYSKLNMPEKAEKCRLILKDMNYLSEEKKR